MVLHETITSSTVRGYDDGNEFKNMDVFRLVGQLHFVGDVAIAEGFLGDMTIADMKQLVKLCIKRGCKYLLSHRRENSGLPVWMEPVLSPHSSTRNILFRRYSCLDRD